MYMYVYVYIYMYIYVYLQIFTYSYSYGCIYRFDEMVDHMKAVAQQPQELTVEERYLLKTYFCTHLYLFKYFLQIFPSKRKGIYVDIYMHIFVNFICKKVHTCYICIYKHIDVYIFIFIYITDINIHYHYHNQESSICRL
jgi:hypothetical protein